MKRFAVACFLFLEAVAAQQPGECSTLQTGPKQSLVVVVDGFTFVPQSEKIWDTIAEPASPELQAFSLLGPNSSLTIQASIKS